MASKRVFAWGNLATTWVESLRDFLFCAFFPQMRWESYKLQLVRDLLLIGPRRKDKSKKTHHTVAKKIFRYTPTKSARYFFFFSSFRSLSAICIRSHSSRVSGLPIPHLISPEDLVGHPQNGKTRRGKSVKAVLRRRVWDWAVRGSSFPFLFCCRDYPPRMEHVHAEIRYGDSDSEKGSHIRDTCLYSAGHAGVWTPRWA